MATNKQLAVKSFNDTLNNAYYQAQLKSTMKDNAGTFATSLMELVTSDEKLLACPPQLLMAEAMKAASLHLPLNKQLGYAYIVPYGNTPTMIIGYKGLYQLAIRSGLYKNINADIVYEGMYEGYDVISGELHLGGSKTSNKVIGYFAFLELTNGFRKMMYMSLEDMCQYARKYSATLKNCKMTNQQLAEMAQKQAESGPGSSVGWYGNFNDMATKTVLRRLLSKYGYLSIEMQNAMTVDDIPTAEEQRDAEFAEAKEVMVVDAETGEIKQPTDEAVPAPDEAKPADNPFK